MTIKGPPIDSTQTGEACDASAAVDDKALMPSVWPRPLTTPTRACIGARAKNGSAPAATGSYGTASACTKIVVHPGLPTRISNMRDHKQIAPIYLHLAERPK